MKKEIMDHNIHTFTTYSVVIQFITILSIYESQYDLTCRIYLMNLKPLKAFEAGTTNQFFGGPGH